MVSSQGQNNFTAASRPANATTVYQKDEFGRFVPNEPVVSAVDINVCRVQTFPAVQGVITAVPGHPVMYHVPSSEFYAAPSTAARTASALLGAAQVYNVAHPVVSEAGAMPLIPV